MSAGSRTSPEGGDLITCSTGVDQIGTFRKAEALHCKSP
jgi:hypothetical protein